MDAPFKVPLPLDEFLPQNCRLLAIDHLLSDSSSECNVIERIVDILRVVPESGVKAESPFVFVFDDVVRLSRYFYRLPLH